MVSLFFEFIELVKIDLFFDEIYVFILDGCIIELLMGVIVVDFVYVVYFDVGNICVGVCVECRNFSLSKLFENG